MEFPAERAVAPAPDGAMTLHIARPPAPPAGAIAAVIVIQEAFGVTAHIRDLCGRFAQAGYLAVAPELYHRRGDGVDLSGRDFSEVRPVFATLTNESIRADLAATLAWLESAEHIPAARAAACGFCMGGLAAMIAACSFPLGAAVSYYGGGMTAPRPGLGFSPVIQEFGRITCPTLLFFGGADSGIPPAQVDEIGAALRAAEVNHELHVAAGAAHGFLNDTRPEVYHAGAAAQSWARTLAFLAERR
jgi:carboxymethylenebutenolidase